MAYEALPYNDIERAELSEFETIVLEQIETLGNQNGRSNDIYNPVHEPVGEAWQRLRGDGKVEFADLWQVHRVEVEGRELTYAHRPRMLFRADEGFKLLARLAGEPEPQDGSTPLRARAEFYVTEFGNFGALARTQFSENGGRISKNRVTRFGEGFGLGVADLSKRLGRKETQSLFEVMRYPEESIVALNALMTLSYQDRRAITKAHHDFDKREANLRKDLKDISQKVAILRA